MTANTPDTLPNLQETTPTHKMSINKVGIRGVKYPIKVLNKDGSIQHSIANVSVYVDCNEESKGINMSRLPIIMNDHIDTPYHMGSMQEILIQLRDKLGSTNSYLKVKFPFFVTKIAPVSKIPSVFEVPVTFTGKLKDGKLTFDVTAEVMGTSCCPCSKMMAATGVNELGQPVGRGAHNQRSVATVTLRINPDSSEVMYIEDLVTLVDNNYSAPIYNVLKRPDEKYVTEQMYGEPDENNHSGAKFSEDVVRDIYMELQPYKERGAVLACSVVSDHEESIHQHNCTSVIADEQFEY
jgi:GTP cyclohydrolase I